MLHWLAKTALDELAALGTTDLSPDEIAELHDAAQAVAHAEQSGGTPSGSGIPISVGGVILWPLTCAAADFWARAADWFSAPGLLTRTLAYALAHGRTPGAFDALCEPRAAAKAVRIWARRLACTEAELDRAIELVLAGATLHRADELRKAAATLLPLLPEGDARSVERALETAIGTTEDRQARATAASGIWRAMVLDFCALTGCSPGDWLIEPTADLARAYASILSARADGAENPAKNAVAQAVGDLRRTISRIHASRSTSL